MRRSLVSWLSCAIFGLLVAAPAASAQVIGTFSWQLQPYCNTLVITVTQIGGVFRLDGYDGQCSASRRAPVAGVATPNPNGTIGLGMTIVSTQSGQPVHVDAFLTLATLNGSWTDSQGNAGNFVFGGVGDGPNILPIGQSVVTKSVTGPAFIGRKGNGVSPGAPVSANSPLVVLDAQGFDGGEYESGALIRAVTTETWTQGGHGTRMHFHTTPNGGLGTTSRMMIDHNGRVGINLGGNDPVDQLDVMGDIRVGTGTTGCVRDRDGTQIAGTGCSSDARFKRDIVSFEPMLGKIAALRPVHYFWRANEFPSRAFGQRQSYGLVAQEVEDVLPELVTTDAEGYKAVNYSKLPLIALQAIKELKSENDTLKEQLGGVLQRLADIEARIKER